jgi:hypothetical protein
MRLAFLWCAARSPPHAATPGTNWVEHEEVEMSRVTRVAVAAALTGLLVAGGLATTVGYVEQRDYAITLAGPTKVKCTSKATIDATIRKVGNGKPVKNQAISWSVVTRQSPSDRVTKDQSTTNRQGVAHVNVKFGNESGKRVIRARIPGAKPTITIRCTEA